MTIHGEASGATKQQLAQDALSLAAGTAGVLLPDQQGTIAPFASAISQMINSVVSIFNATGIFQHKTQPQN